MSGLFHWVTWAPWTCFQDQECKKIQPSGFMRPEKTFQGSFLAFAEHSCQLGHFVMDQDIFPLPWLEMLLWHRLIKEVLGTGRAWIQSPILVKLWTHCNFDSNPNSYVWIFSPHCFLWVFVFSFPSLSQCIWRRLCRASCSMAQWKEHGLWRWASLDLQCNLGGGLNLSDPHFLTC